MKKVATLLLSLMMIISGAFACEMKYIISFGDCFTERKVKNKCDVTKQETNKILLQLDHNKDVVCLGKVEENGSVIMTYDDAGVIKKIIFKKCNKDKMRNKLYYIYLIGLYREVDIF